MPVILLALALGVAGQTQSDLNRQAGDDWKRADAAMNAEYAG